MRVSCKANRGSAIPEKDRYLGEVDVTNYSYLILGEEYQVYALMMISERLDYLVCGGSLKPFWTPSCLFEPLDMRLPNDWELQVITNDSEHKGLLDLFNTRYIFGYSELVNNYSHYEGLIDRNPEDLKKFWLIVNSYKTGNN